MYRLLVLCLLWGPAWAQYPAHPRTSPDITAADFSARDRALADDAFGGRGPGTPEGEAAASWIAEEMQLIGLLPGNHGSYFQVVPAVRITLDPQKSSFSMATAKGGMTPRYADELVYWTPQYQSSEVSVRASPMVFVGYGVVAPEYGWNDYAGVDVRGKTAVILINDPGNEDAHPDPAFFKGKAMTYYGRWTYKYEEAARQGAAAALIVHETAPAAYGWQVVRNSNSGTKIWVNKPDGNAGDLAIEGWMSLGVAKDLFKRAGLDYAQEKQAANRRGFTPVALPGAYLDATAHSSIDFAQTKNVVGVLPGREKPDEMVLLTAHWDHLGTKPSLPGADKIYNGAIDNASGVASILEVAEAFTHRAPAPRRSVAFLCWTLEEQGLLGSDYFAHHPIWKPRNIVGGINIDSLLPEGRARDMVVIGSGASELENVLAAQLTAQGRVISADPEPEKGFFYRSDHISLAKIGVPMLYVKGGYDLREGGKPAGMAISDSYRTTRYHLPSDEFDPNWDLSGPIEDLHIVYDVASVLADGTMWPNWFAGNEFRAARDLMLAKP